MYYIMGWPADRRESMRGSIVKIRILGLQEYIICDSNMSIYEVIKVCFDGYGFTSIFKRCKIQVLFLARNMANLIKLYGI